MVRCSDVMADGLADKDLALKPAIDEDEVSTGDESSSAEEALHLYCKRFGEAFEGDCQVTGKKATQHAYAKGLPVQATGYDVPKDLYPFLGLGSDSEASEPQEASEKMGEDGATFRYAGNLDKQPPMAMFDIRDEVCLRVGGFKHGQVVRDASGGELVVIGVKPADGVLRLWFQPKDLNRAGAGAFPEAAAEELRARFTLVPAARAAGNGRLLREVSPENFQVVEDADGEQMCLCSHCRLPLGNFECLSNNKNAARVHGECLAQLMLRSLREETEAREKEAAALKKARRAEYDIGWKVEHIPRGLALAKELGCGAQQSMFCLALDADTRSVRVVPTIEPAASVNLEYLSLALQVRLLEGREPFFSLDPVDPCDRASMQEKRFEPAWLAGTSAGEVLFQADYHLKELSMGEYAQPVVGMKSCLDLSAEEGEFNAWSAREWFVVNHAEVQLSEDMVLVPSLKMGVEAREQFVGPNGMEDVRVTRPDHPLVKYAEAFTERFDLIAERKSVIHHLRELAKASVLAKFVLDAEVQLQEEWFQPAADDKDACCLEIPQLWNERYHSQIRVQDGKILDAGKAGYKSVSGVYGGVEFGIDKFDLSQPTQNFRLRSVVAPAAPTMGLRLPAPRSVAAPVLETALARAARVVPTARGVPEGAIAVPRFSKRVKGVGAARGVDLNLDQFDLSSPEKVASTFQASGDCGCLGGAFWSCLADEADAVFGEEDKTLLKGVFNPHLSDRRDEGDRFVPPDSSLAYVESLRGIVKKEEQVRQMRKSHFLGAGFSESNAGPLFPASWATSFEVATGEADGKELHARADYMAAAMVFEQALKAAAPVFDKTAEDGMRFRIYRFGSVEVRSTQEHEGKEVIGVIFSVRAAKKAAPSAGNVDEEAIVRATEYVEAGEGAVASRSYVVFETASGLRVASEKRADGSVTWVVEPKDLEDRNSLAKLVRAADLPEALPAGDVREVLSAQATEGTSPCEQKQFAQGAFCVAAGLEPASGFRQPAKAGKWQLSMEGHGGWHGANAQRYSKQSIRIRCGK